MSERTDIDHYDFWFDLPPEPSPRMAKHVRKIAAGWVPSARIEANGRDACSAYFDVYQSEWYVLAALYRRDQHMLDYHNNMTDAATAWMTRFFPDVPIMWESVDA